MKVTALRAFAHLLLGGAPVGEANRDWLLRRCEHDDWLEGDEARIREMLPAALLDELSETDD
jgi:hypothetical protein